MVGAFELFGELNELLGFTIKESKDLLPSPYGTILGLIARLDASPFEVGIDPERRDKLIAAIDGILEAGRLRPAQAFRPQTPPERCRG